METAAPTKFGKYDVVGVLGKGAMGIVYDCRDPVIGRRVAIKTVLKESLDSSEAEGLLGRFKQEAQAAGRLNHPGVVSIYDYGETSDVAFIAMEYISGKELKSYFDKGEKFALSDTVRIMSAILEALEHAHQSCLRCRQDRVFPGDPDWHPGRHTCLHGAGTTPHDGG